LPKHRHPQPQKRGKEQNNKRSYRGRHEYHIPNTIAATQQEAAIFETLVDINIMFLIVNN